MDSAIIAAVKSPWLFCSSETGAVFFRETFPGHVAFSVTYRVSLVVVSRVFPLWHTKESGMLPYSFLCLFY